MSRAGYVWDERYLGHPTSTIHPERPERAEVLRAGRMTADLPGLLWLPLDVDLGLPWARRVHDAAYLDEVRTAHAVGLRALDRGETLVNSDTFDVALASAAGACTAVQAVLSGTVDRAFAAIRPPGHHAGPAHARGFCVFNNVAIAARYAQGAFGLGRVLIVDWDVHPADGTSGIFYSEPSVFVLSLHQEGLFPPSVGAREQTGAGEGEGTIANVPLAPFTPAGDYLAAFEDALDRHAARARPDLVLVSCGFDAHSADPLSDMSLDEASFRSMTKLVRQVATAHCDGRVVSVLEGGYNLQVLPRCVRAHLEALMD